MAQKNKERPLTDGAGIRTESIPIRKEKMAGKKRIGRIMTAVRAALKKEGVYLAPEILRKLEEAITGRWYEIIVTSSDLFASELLTMNCDCSESYDRRVDVTDSKIESYVHGNVKAGKEHYYTRWECEDWEEDYDDSYYEKPCFDSNDVFVVLKKVRSYTIRDRQASGYSFSHQIIIYVPKKSRIA